MDPYWDEANSATWMAKRGWEADYTQGAIWAYYHNDQNEEWFKRNIISFLERHSKLDLFAMSGGLHAIGQIRNKRLIRLFLDNLWTGSLRHNIDEVMLNPLDGSADDIVVSHAMCELFYENRNLYAVLDLAETKPDHVMRLLRNIPSRITAMESAYHIGPYSGDIEYHYKSPLQYAVSLPHITLPMIKCLLDEGCGITDVFASDLPRPIQPSLYRPLLNHLLFTVSIRTNLRALCRPIIRLVVELDPTAQMLLRGGILHDLLGVPTDVPSWQIEHPSWLSIYLEAVFSDATFHIPDWVQQTLLRPPIFTTYHMTCLWRFVGGFIYRFDTDARKTRYMNEFMDPFIQQIVSPSMLALCPAERLACIPGAEIMQDRLFQYAGFADEMDVLTAMQTINRPMRICWLLDYYRMAPSECERERRLRAIAALILCFYNQNRRDLALVRRIVDIFDLEYDEGLHTHLHCLDPNHPDYIVGVIAWYDH